MSITLEFTPWSPFQAKKDDAQIRSWLESIGRAAEAAFKKGASRPWPGSGPWDLTPGAPPGEWPMRRSGNLLGTIGHQVTADSVTVGSSASSPRGFNYSNWLRKTGRKMSPEALQEGLANGDHLSRWVIWSRL